LGVIMKQLQERDLTFAKNPISLPIVVWVFYNLVQVINPVAASRLAWAYTVRSMALLILLYFIACYALNSYQRIITIFKFMLGLAFASALYGMKQEFIGFADFELAWLYADPARFQLIFQWSRMRVFSFFSDPTNYGIYMSYMSVMCFILLIGKFKIWQKAVLGTAGVCMLLAIAYAGSRTPVVLVPFGFAVFTMLSLKRNVIIAMGICGLLGIGLVFKSTGNAVLFRIQSAFMPDRSGDTMGVRFENQKKIKPFIQSHPFGAGLGSVGEWGQRFSPDTFLASFPPDSGYVRVAVELGWVGYLIYCWLLYMIIRMGIKYYLRARNEQIKIIYLALTCMMFMLILASYVQEAIVQLPTSINFYICLAIIVRLKDFEDEADLAVAPNDSAQKLNE
ncbi:MAG: O-antigen ligase family protein, partial [Bacteroidota bacterium]